MVKGVFVCCCFFSIALVIAGIVLLAVTQIVLWKKIKKFNEEWEDEQNEMS